MRGAEVIGFRPGTLGIASAGFVSITFECGGVGNLAHFVAHISPDDARALSKRLFVEAKIASEVAVDKPETR